MGARKSYRLRCAVNLTSRAYQITEATRSIAAIQAKVWPGASRAQQLLVLPSSDFVHFPKHLPMCLDRGISDSSVAEPTL